jgi:hypothetical protein
MILSEDYIFSILVPVGKSELRNVKNDYRGSSLRKGFQNREEPLPGSEAYTQIMDCLSDLILLLRLLTLLWGFAMD